MLDALDIAKLVQQLQVSQLFSELFIQIRGSQWAPLLVCGVIHIRLQEERAAVALNKFLWDKDKGSFANPSEVSYISKIIMVARDVLQNY